MNVNRARLSGAASARTLIAVLAGLLAIAGIIVGLNAIAFRSVDVLRLAGGSTGPIAAMLIVAAAIWRLWELAVRFFPSLAGRMPGLFQMDQGYVHLRVWFVLCLVSAICFQLPLLGAHGGIKWEDGGLGRNSVAGGVIPFADAKQHLNAGVGMPTMGLMGSLAARRPVHAANLAAQFSLLDFERYAVLSSQAALCGIFLAIVCVFLSRLFGGPAALAVWAITFLLIEPAIPTFMTEPTGLWMGCIGFLVLCTAAITRNAAFLCLALLVFILAFSARAGAMFVLPAIIFVGFWYCRHSLSHLGRYLLLLVVVLAIGAAIPRTLLSVYDTRGGVYQGNLNYLLYQFAVGSDDWRQIRFDYAEDLSRLKLRHEQAEFMREKAREAFLANPTRFFTTILTRGIETIITMPPAFYYRLIKPDIDNPAAVHAFLEQRPLMLLHFYVSLAALLILGIRRSGFAMGFFLILSGYAISIPWIFFGNAIRFQAVTYVLTALFISGLLVRRGSRAAPASTALPMVLGIGVVAWVAASGLIPFAYQTDFLAGVNRRHGLKLPDGQRVEYLLAGPYMPFVRLVDTNEPISRPDIGYNEFANLKRIARDDHLLRPYAPGDQFSVIMQLPSGSMRYYWSAPLCVPDRMQLYRAVVSQHTDDWRFIYDIHKVEPIGKGGEVLPWDGDLPFECR